MITRPDAERTAQLLDKAITIAGSQGKLAKAIGRSQNAVWHAKSTGRVTAEIALAIDQATEGQVSRHDLRPDVYGAEPLSGTSEAA